MTHTKTSITELPFLQGGGEMGALTRAYNWEMTSLGSPRFWPISLRGYLNLLLNSKFPMFLFWGPEHLCFYNDAYRTRLGADGKHPGMLGMKGAEAWFEVWEFIGPLVNGILEGGEALLCEDQPLAIYRNGVLDNGFWTFSYSPVIDDSGSAAGVFVTCTETTKAVNLVNQLQHTNETVKLAIEAGELGVVEVDLITEEVIITEKIEKIFGLRSGSKRTDFYLQMHPDDLVTREEAYQKAYQDGRLEYESRVYHSNGSMRWIRLKGTIFFDDFKRPLKMISVVQDITEQKLFSQELSRQVKARTEELEQAHDLLVSSNDYLQRVINVFTSALQVLEPVVDNGVIIDFIYKQTNEAYAAYANKKPADLKGKRISEFFPGYFDTDSFKNIREVAITGVPKIWENHYAADGLNIYNEMGAVKMNGDIIVHLNDFTKLKQLQLELERNITELKRSNQNLEEFAHAASHDLKEPIRKIHFYTNRLKTELGTHLSEGEMGSFTRIEKASERMGNLIDDLLLYSHVSERPHATEPVDLNESISRVIEDLELDIKEKGAVLQIDKLPVINGYRRQMQQLMQNLIGNALKYSRAEFPPHIIITAHKTEIREQLFHVIKVQDNGIGFDEEHKEKIFQLFARLHNKSEYSGTGIGLTIVQKVVDNHRGSITAESAVGKGATFNVYLPVDLL